MQRRNPVAVDYQLLFGLLALQIGMINQGQLVAAFQEWTLQKARSLADDLVARGDLESEQRALLLALDWGHARTFTAWAPRFIAS
jgi:hypothetical protein